MSSISPLGARQYQNTALAGSGQQKTGNTTPAAPSSKLGSNVALSPGGVDLQQRVDSLGNNTIDLAQSFLGTFAQKLLGDDAKGATIAFDSVSLEASSSMSAGWLQADGAAGVKSASAFSLSESSHFLGKGTITLADGTKYDFEVEVQYEASMSAGAVSSGDKERQKLLEQNPAMPLPTLEFPDIDWPGSLADLFKLMDKQISGDVKNEEGTDQLGTLSMRLLKLVNNTESLDTYAPAPIKAGTSAYAAEQAASADAAEEAALPAPVKAPPGQLMEPEVVPDVPVKTADGIPLTISTTPPAGDAA